MKTIMMVIMMQIMEIAITTGAIMMVILDPSVVLVSSVLSMVIVVPVVIDNVVVLGSDPNVVGVDELLSSEVPLLVGGSFVVPASGVLIVGVVLSTAFVGNIVVVASGIVGGGV